MRKYLAAGLLAAGLALTLCACGGAQTAEPAPEEAAEPVTETAEEATEAENVFADGVLTTKDIRFEITDWKVIPVGEKGNEYGEKPVIAFWYNVTNITGAQPVTPMASWVVMFQAFQDTDPNQVNELGVGMLPDEAFLESQLEEVKPGGTAQCAVAYELDSDTVPVVLRAGAMFGGSGYGEKEFDITQSASTKPTEAVQEPAPSETAAQEPAAQPTMGQKNAVQKAQTYLKFSGFSKQGLVEQLKYEGFTEEEAAYGAENCGADWKEQAVVKANTYMKVMSYSRQGLIDQLKYEGFTEEEAEYGATGVGY